MEPPKEFAGTEPQKKFNKISAFKLTSYVFKCETESRRKRLVETRPQPTSSAAKIRLCERVRQGQAEGSRQKRDSRSRAPGRSRSSGNPLSSGMEKTLITGQGLGRQQAFSANLPAVQQRSYGMEMRAWPDKA